MPTKNKKFNKLGLGVAALAIAAAAGGYFLYGKDGKNRRDKVKGWMLKARGEVLEKMEMLKKIDKEEYNRIVDSISTKYKKLKSVNKKELKAFNKEMKDYWSKFTSEVSKGAAKVSKKANKSVKKLSEKSVQKKKK